ncbi:hypothetical protein MHYP_G00350420 [Metynnis hypsauchen]
MNFTSASQQILQFKIFPALFIHSNDDGWFELDAYAISLNTVLQLGSEEDHLSISTVVCSANVGSVQVNFHGGASFIYQLFVDIFSNRITDEIHAKICPAFQQGIKGLESHLAVMPVAIKMGSYVYMNVTLTESPLIKSTGLELNVKGEFYSITSPSEPPFFPKYFNVPWREDYMMSLGASEFCVNSAAYAFQSAGVLQMLITDDMIPKASPIHLNTSQFGILIPQLPKKYPDMPMQVQLYASETPLVSFNETVTNVHLLASAKAFAMGPDSAAIPLFRLDVESSISAKAFTDKQLLKGVLEMKNFTMTLGSTEIGDFPIGPIEGMMKFAVTSLVIPKVNALLKDGIMVPFVTGFNISNSVMTIENGFVAIAADISVPEDSWQ